MLAAVLAQIDGLDGDGEERQRRRLDRGGVAGEREDRAVVRRVGRMVEQADAGVARIACARRSMTSGRRPSLTLGMDSMIGMRLFVAQAFGAPSPSGGFLFDGARPAVP